MKKIFVLYTMAGLFFLMQAGLSAQVSIAFSASKDSFEIGEDIPVELKINFENDQTTITGIRFSVLDSMGIMKYLFPDDSLFVQATETDFDISDYGQWVNNQKKEFSEKELQWITSSQKNAFINKLAIKVWDPGTFRVMITELQYRDKTGKIIQYFPKTNEALVVQILHLPKNEKNELAPIDPIIKRQFPEVYLSYFLLIFSIIALIITLIGLFKKRPAKSTNWQFPEKPLQPAHEIALKKLNKLAAEAYHEKGEIKLFYSELSHILRAYIESRYNLPALEITTDELIKALSYGDLTESLKNRLERIFQVADLVKFAKAEPTSEIHISMLQEAKDFVEHTKFITVVKGSDQ